MTIRTTFVLAAIVVSCAPGLAGAQSPSSDTARPPAQALDGNYQGTLVCEQMPYAGGPLRAPLDINVSSNGVQFARPIFSLDGSRVIGSEIGAGTLEADGKLHLVSSWITNGATAQATYDGVLTIKGGTLSGNQNWVLGGEPHTRQCFAAIVKSRLDPPTR